MKPATLSPRRLACTLLGAAALSLSACAYGPVQQASCVDVDWFETGRSDGLAGSPGAQIAAHRQACAGTGAVPMASAYEQGRLEGLETYCTLATGLETGKAGIPVSEVCPEGMNYYFLTGHALGRQMFDLQGHQDAALARVERLERRLNDTALRAERRAELERELRGLRRESSRLSYLMLDLELEEQRIVVDTRLRAYQSSFATVAR